MNPSSTALTTANTTSKIVGELEKMILDLLKMLVKLIPDPTVANTMKKEMEKGHVKVEFFNEEDKDQVKDLLAEKGLKEGKDYIMATYHRIDGENYASVFYNIKDEHLIHETQKEMNHNSNITKDNYDFLQTMGEVGVNLDGTVDIDQFNAFCKSKGINVDLSKELTQDEKSLVSAMFTKQYQHYSPNQLNKIALGLKSGGALDKLAYNKSPGVVDAQTLYGLSKEQGTASIKRINGLSSIEAYTLSEKATANGLRICVEGPNINDQYVVSFASKDINTMKRAYADMKYDLQGEVGDIYKQYYDFKNTYATETINTALTGQLPDKATVPEGSMIVSTEVKPLNEIDKAGNLSDIKDENGDVKYGRQTLTFGKNNYVLNAEDATRGKNVIAKDDKKSIESLFGNPNIVYLNPQQAEAYRTAIDEKARLDILNEAKESGEHGFASKPILTQENIEKIQKHESLREIVHDDLTKNLGEENISKYESTISSLEDMTGLGYSTVSNAVVDEDYVQTALSDIENSLETEIDNLEDGTKEFEASYIFETNIIGGDISNDLDIQIEDIENESIGSMMEDRDTLENLSNE